MGDKPVNFVGWYDAIRFANWLHNGQGSGDTETGAYTLGTLDAVGEPLNGAGITRNAGATWFLTSEDEWYKAAYYDPTLSGGSGDYWDYATQSNSAPTVATANSVGDISNPGVNVANYNQGADWNSVDGNLTTVGSAGPLSESYYGTSDQSGNVWEWNEAIISGSSRGLRGGGLSNIFGGLLASVREDEFPTAELANMGFRVATVPEPATLMLAGLGLACIAVWGVGKRRRGGSHPVIPKRACWALVALALSAVAARADGEIVTYAFSGVHNGQLSSGPSVNEVLAGYDDGDPFSGTVTYDTSAAEQSAGVYPGQPIRMTIVLDNTHALNWNAPGSADQIWLNSSGGGGIYVLSMRKDDALEQAVPSQSGVFVDWMSVDFVTPNEQDFPADLASLDPLSPLLDRGFFMQLHGPSLVPEAQGQDTTVLLFDVITSIAPAPEPSSLVLAATAVFALAGLTILRRDTRHAAQSIRIA
jgi:hypothetical protein